MLGNAVWFGDTYHSIVTSSAITPIGGQQPRAISVWIRTTSKSSGAYIYPSGKFTFPENSFRLLLANGILKLQIDAQTQLQANQGIVRLNDYHWHHVAVTFQRVWSGIVMKDEVLFYIDGQKYSAANTITKMIFTQTNSDTVNIGGTTDQSIEGWTGSLDDFAIWASALTPPMIKAIKTCAQTQTLAYNARDMESLFKLYRKKAGSAVIKGLTWKYSATLSGTTGICELQNTANTYSLKLSDDGQGVRTNSTL